MQAMPDLPDTLVSERPTRADARRNFDRLIAVAQEVIRRDGDDASLEAIARAAGVGTGTLYRHFPTREHLYMAVMNDTWEDLHAYAQDLIATASPEEALVTWLGRFTQSTLIFHGIATRVVAAIGKEGMKATSSCQHVLQDGETLFDHARAAGVIRPTATWPDVGVLLHGLISAAECTADGRQRADRMLQIVLDGILTTPKP